MPHAEVNFGSLETGVSAGTLTDSEGNYAVQGLAAGTYTVYLRKAVMSRYCQRTFTLPSLEDMDAVNFALDPLRAVRGTVLNPAGALVSGASVVAIPTTNYIRLIRDTDNEGIFEIPLDEQIATVYLQAYGDGCVSPRMGPVKPGAGYTLTLADAGSIEGVVVDRSGQPVPEAIVVGIPSDDDRITALNADGSEWDPKTRRSGHQGAHLSRGRLRDGASVAR